MAWTTSARLGEHSLPGSSAAREGRTLMRRCAVRRKIEGRRERRAAAVLAVGEPIEVAAHWPHTPDAQRCHDLRTPLNAVIGFTDLMRQELYGPVGNPRYAEYLEHIASSARALLRTTEDTLAPAARSQRAR